LTVGATTAIFSVVQAVLLRELPYGEAHQVFWIGGINRAAIGRH
jgi:hypothetical protein